MYLLTAHVCAVYQGWPKQTRTQLLQYSSQRVQFHLLIAGSSLSEALKRLRHIVLFALQAARRRSLRMTSQPPSYHPTKAVLQPGPGFLVAVYVHTSEQLDAIALCAFLTTAKSVYRGRFTPEVYGTHHSFRRHLLLSCVPAWVYPLSHLGDQHSTVSCVATSR
jgi:hypothetical protein